MNSNRNAGSSVWSVMSNLGVARRLVPAVALLAFAGTAEAGRHHRHSYEDRADSWLLEGGIGFRAGSMLLDGIDMGTVKPGHIEVGMRNNRMLLALEYQFASLKIPDEYLTMPMDGAPRSLVSGNGRGIQHQIMPLARYSFGRAGDDEAGTDLFVEGGVGLNQTRWDAGGVLTRPEVSFGIGGSFWGLGKERHGGLAMGLRVTVAHRNDNLDAPAACGGPCDHPTTPTHYDRAFMFDMTMMFGK